MSDAGGQEREREADPEGLERQRAEVDLGLHRSAKASGRPYS